MSGYLSGLAETLDERNRLAQKLARVVTASTCLTKTLKAKPHPEIAVMQVVEQVEKIFTER